MSIRGDLNNFVNQVNKGKEIRIVLVTKIAKKGDYYHQIILNPAVSV